MSDLHVLLARTGAAESLAELANSADDFWERTDLEDLFAARGSTAPDALAGDFLRANLIQPHANRFCISAFGQRTALLLEALRGGDIEDVFRRLRRLSGRSESYELIQEEMTELFFRTLHERPSFGTLYFCSPWINPTVKQAAVLRYSMLQMERRRGMRPDVLVLSRRPEQAPPQTQAGLKAFFDVGAKVYYNSRLHSKLYIREPDAGGGFTLAIVGSQNLTRSTNIELGIRINNDTRLIDQLIRYFLRVACGSDEHA